VTATEYCEDCAWFGARREGQPCSTVACLHAGALNTPPAICRDQPETPWRDDCERSRKSYSHCRGARHWKSKEPPDATAISKAKRDRVAAQVGARFVTVMVHLFLWLPLALLNMDSASEHIQGAVVGWACASIALGALRPFRFMLEPQP
jgi:hypothetical protein